MQNLEFINEAWKFVRANTKPYNMLESYAGKRVLLQKFSFRDECDKAITCNTFDLEKIKFEYATQSYYYEGEDKKSTIYFFSKPLYYKIDTEFNFSRESLGRIRISAIYIEGVGFTDTHYNICEGFSFRDSERVLIENDEVSAINPGSLTKSAK